MNIKLFKLKENIFKYLNLLRRIYFFIFDLIIVFHALSLSLLRVSAYLLYLNNKEFYLRSVFDE